MSNLMKNPEVLAMVESKLNSLTGTLSGYYDTLPNVVKRRVKALKKLQVDILKIEANYHKEVHELECKYLKLYEPLFDRRSEIINAKVEPTDEECDFPSDIDEEDEEKAKESIEMKGNKDNEKKMEVEKQQELESQDDVKGIPEFWLTIFKNVELIDENIQEWDEPILKHLIDVKLKLENNPMNFTLEFYFSPNEYFTNSVLTKKYELKCNPVDKDPFAFDGPEIYKCIGCVINWNKDKNVTVKTVMRKQKHKTKGTTRQVPKQVPSESFFNFFSPPEIPEDEKEMDENTQAILSADFEIGETIRHRLIPRAVLYFTGEALMDDYDDEEDEFETEEEDDSEEDDVDEDEENEGKGKNKGKESEKKSKGKGEGKQENPQECKQQ